MNRIAYYLLLASIVCLSACRKDGGAIEAWPYAADTLAGWGLLQSDGRPMVQAGTFARRPTPVVRGMFAVADSLGRWHLHDARSPLRPVSARSFARVGHFFEPGVAPAQETADGPILLVDRRGQTVASLAQYPQYDFCLSHNFSDGRMLVMTRTGKYGFVDTAGRIVIPPLYDFAADFSEGRALVGVADAAGRMAYQLIDRQGNVARTLQLSGCLLHRRLADGRLAYTELATGRCCYLEADGGAQLYLPAQVVYAEDFAHGLAVCRTEAGCGTIGRDGRIQIPPRYVDAFVAASDRVALLQPDGWRLADAEGEAVTGSVFRQLTPFGPADVAVACGADSLYRLIDRQGQDVSLAYACLVDDPVAAGREVQRFVRHDPHEVQPSVAAAPEPHDLPATTSARPEPDEPPVPATVTHTTDWQTMARDNPFYAEAVKVLSGHLTEDDARRRRLILNYMEHLRTSYTTKDIDFLEQLFSERALIVVGTVIRASANSETGYLPPARVVYNLKSKRQYLDRLKEVFRANRQIDVRFTDFSIMRHPTRPGIYGVTVRQAYRSDLYSDDGYLFLLWDFADETAPQIHVRTWQPYWLDNQTPLARDSVLGIRDFNLK